MKRVKMWFCWGAVMAIIWFAAAVPNFFLYIYEFYNPEFVAGLSTFILVLDIMMIILVMLIKIFMTIAAILYLYNEIEKYDEQQKKFEFEKTDKI